MGEIKQASPVKLFCGLIFADISILNYVREELTKKFGEIDGEFGPIPFDWTDYYEAEMGGNLQKMFLSFARLIDPSEIKDIKIITNRIEELFCVDGIKRRVNIDPGYITPAKLVLATTKDFSHRIYIGEGIYAEVTLNFAKNGFISYSWSYPDYKSGKYDEFFRSMRKKLMEQEKHNKEKEKNS